MSYQVDIKRGFYRGMPFKGVFLMVRPYKEGARGGQITIKNPKPMLGHPPVQRITVEPGDFTVLDAAGNPVADNVVISEHALGSAAADFTPSVTDYESIFVSAETDEEAMDRIEETFSMLNKIVDASARGIIRGLVVSGPPGVGKSFGVEATLNEANLLRVLAGQDPLYEIVSGGVSPVGLYQKLYNSRRPEQVLVFDDADGILFEEESLNLLKAALNSGDRRRICWNKESRILAEADMPNSFDFEGSIIFLTNIDFERSIAKNSRISAHLAAIMSRCHYLDLEIGSLRDKMLRIRQIIRDGMLKPYDFSPEQELDVQHFIADNSEYLREVSLRMVKKIADFVKADPANWRTLAESTCLQREAKFKRLVEQRRTATAGAVLAGE